MKIKAKRIFCLSLAMIMVLALLVAILASCDKPAPASDNDPLAQGSDILSNEQIYSFAAYANDLAKQNNVEIELYIARSSFLSWNDGDPSAVPNDIYACVSIGDRFCAYLFRSEESMDFFIGEKHVDKNNTVVDRTHFIVLTEEEEEGSFDKAATFNHDNFEYKKQVDFVIQNDKKNYDATKYVINEYFMISPDNIIIQSSNDSIENQRGGGNYCGLVDNDVKANLSAEYDVIGEYEEGGYYYCSYKEKQA